MKRERGKGMEEDKEVIDSGRRDGEEFFCTNGEIDTEGPPSRGRAQFFLYARAHRSPPFSRCRGVWEESRAAMAQPKGRRYVQKTTWEPAQDFPGKGSSLSPLPPSRPSLSTS